MTNIIWLVKNISKYVKFILVPAEHSADFEAGKIFHQSLLARVLDHPHLEIIPQGNWLYYIFYTIDSAKAVQERLSSMYFFQTILCSSDFLVVMTCHDLIIHAAF